MSTGDDLTPSSYTPSDLVTNLHGYPRSVDNADTFGLDGAYWTAVEVETDVFYRKRHFWRNKELDRQEG